MPTTSDKQHRYMEMIAHGGKPKGGGGPSQAVAKEFVEADKSEGKTYKNGLHRMVPKKAN